MSRQTVVALVISILALRANPVSAELVTFEFAGEVTHVWDDDGLLGGAVTGGSPFSGLYTFESTTPDSDPDEPRHGLYNDAIMLVSGDVAGISFAGPAGTLNAIEVLDFPDTSFDKYRVFAEITLLDIGLDLSLSAHDASGTAIQSESLPITPPDLALFGFTMFSVFDGSEAIPLGIDGQLTSLVPEPVTLVLFGTVGLLVSRRRRTPISVNEVRRK
ncbi:MAG: PEP-CTERM sorting domain-containing protein [Phycisphaerales bacterium]|nr:MAG: PEP-CTERM sorting domain-containing protein [Phycisphaerales bacterium]